MFVPKNSVSPWQICDVVEPVETESMVTLYMTKLSQLLVETKLSITTPAVVMVCPSITIELPWQKDVSILVIRTESTDKVRIVILSHPLFAVLVSL